MNIGMTTFGGDGGKSGISQYIIHLLSAFSAMSNDDRFELYMYSSERGIFIPNGQRTLPIAFGEGIRNPLVNIAWHQWSLASWCRRRGHDVLFLPAGNRRLPASVPCPTVATVHDLSSLHVPEKYDRARHFYITKVLPWLVRTVSHVLTVSESSKRDIVEYAGVPDDRISVIPNGVDHTVYYPRERGACLNRIARRYGIDRPYILYVSRIEHPGKNHIRLIRAFDHLKAREDIPHQLVLAGSDWTGAEIVHSAAREAKFSDDIVFTGFVPTEQLPHLYGGAQLSAFPSLYEGFGIPVLEAMACGVPVVCSNTSSLPEVAGNAAIQFDPMDHEAMASAMLYALSDGSMRQTMTARGLKQSAAYTWSETARRTLMAIRGVC